MCHKVNLNLRIRVSFTLILKLRGAIEIQWRMGNNNNVDSSIGCGKIAGWLQWVIIKNPTNYNGRESFYLWFGHGGILIDWTDNTAESLNQRWPIGV
jgi:hypothetical protein